MNNIFDKINIGSKIQVFNDSSCTICSYMTVIDKAKDSIKCIYSNEDCSYIDHFYDKYIKSKLKLEKDFWSYQPELLNTICNIDCTIPTIDDINKIVSEMPSAFKNIFNLLLTEYAYPQKNFIVFSKKGEYLLYDFESKKYSTESSSKTIFCPIFTIKINSEFYSHQTHIILNNSSMYEIDVYEDEKYFSKLLKNRNNEKIYLHKLDGNKIICNPNMIGVIDYIK